MTSLVVYEFGVASIELKQLWESENFANISQFILWLIIVVPMKQGNLGIHHLQTTPKNLSSWLVLYKYIYTYIQIYPTVTVIYQLRVSYNYKQVTPCIECFSSQRNNQLPSGYLTQPWKITIFKFGKPSISMGHLKTMANCQS